MMKRVLGALLVLVSSLGVEAQVVDAFQGILPVTDPQMKLSLNGEWSLKVVDGITDNTTVHGVESLSLVVGKCMVSVNPATTRLFH